MDLHRCFSTNHWYQFICFRPLVYFAIPAILIGTLSLSAHHAFRSEFDEAKVVQFKGTVQLFARMNPHGYIFVDGRNEKGEIEHWALETLTTAQLDSYGLGKVSLKVGDVVEVCGFATKDGVTSMKSYQAPEPISLSLKSIPRPILTGKVVWPKTLTLPDGKKLTFGQGTCGN